MLRPIFNRRTPLVLLNLLLALALTAQVPNSTTAVSALENQAAILFQHKEYAEAFSAYQQAANLGSSTSQNILGDMYRQGQGVPQNYAQAFIWYSKAAQQENPNAEDSLGYLYAKGMGVIQNDPQAFSWYSKAAQHGLPVGQVDLGIMYLNGTGVPQDKAQARTWFEKAADQGFAPGNDWLAQMGELQTYYSYHITTPGEYGSGSIDFEKGYYKTQLKKGDLSGASNAAFGIGKCYLDGQVGNKAIKPDEAQAIEWFHNAGDDNAAGAAYVGYRFLGQDIPAIKPDAEQAERWLRLAATSTGVSPEDRANAQFNLGLAYIEGDVLRQDTSQGIHWLLEAASSHDAHATLLLGQLYRDGKIVPQNPQLSQGFLDSAPQLFATEQANYDVSLAQKQAFDEQMAQIKAQRHVDMVNAIAGGISYIQSTATTSRSVQAATVQQITKLNASSQSEQQLNLQQVIQEALQLQATQPQQQANIAAAQAKVQKPQQQPAGQRAAQQAQHTQPTQQASSTPPSAPRPAQPTQYNTSFTSGVSTTTPQAATTSCPNPSSGLAQVANCVPAECHNMDLVVHLESEWFTAAPDADREVVAYVTNNSISPVTCTTAFHKNGQWTEYGTGTFGPNAIHVGGQGGGLWTMGADSSDVKYMCFEGKDPVDAQGNLCNANLVFTGQTRAGTDRH